MTTDIEEFHATSKSANSKPDHTSSLALKAATPVTASPQSSPPPPPPPPPSLKSPPPRKPRRLLCRKEVEHRVGISRATTYRYAQRTLQGEFDFPLPVQIGLGRIGWHEHEIDAWIDGRPRTTDDK